MPLEPSCHERVQMPQELRESFAILNRHQAIDDRERLDRRGLSGGIPRPSCDAVRVRDDYFDERGVNRQRLLWAIATRRQLERWEPLVAATLRDSFAHRERSSERIWAAAIEHHFALIAAHHLLVALDLPPASGASVDPIVRAEITEGRHLHEHWPDNMPVFNRRAATEPRS